MFLRARALFGVPNMDVPFAPLAVLGVPASSVSRNDWRGGALPPKLGVATAGPECDGEPKPVRGEPECIPKPDCGDDGVRVEL